MRPRVPARFSPAPEQGRRPSTWMSWNHQPLKVQFCAWPENYTTFKTLQLAKCTDLSAPHSCTGASVWKTSGSAAVTGRRAGRSPAPARGACPAGGASVLRARPRAEPARPTTPNPPAARPRRGSFLTPLLNRRQVGRPVTRIQRPGLHPHPRARGTEYLPSHRTNPLSPPEGHRHLHTSPRATSPEVSGRGSRPAAYLASASGGLDLRYRVLCWHRGDSRR